MVATARLEKAGFGASASDGSAPLAGAKKPTSEATKISGISQGNPNVDRSGMDRYSVKLGQLVRSTYGDPVFMERLHRLTCWFPHRNTGGRGFEKFCKGKGKGKGKKKQELTRDAPQFFGFWLRLARKKSSSFDDSLFFKF